MDKALQKSKAGVGWVEAWCHDPIGRAYLFLPVSPNESRLINYGKEHREGQSHLHGQVESTVDQLVGFRMEKKQHMRWSQRGA